jgi:hypothetical protein
VYQFKEECNHNQFFWWNKKLIENMNWALLPKASKAVFPVIASHANEKGAAWPSEQTIAILSGVSDKIAREGIRGLEAFPSFKWSHHLSKRGKRAKKYFVKLPSCNNKGSAFPFHKFILHSGIWRKLKSSAKSVYPVMRYFGFFDISLYAALEDSELCEADFEEVYRLRKYDFCEAENGLMAEYAGLHRNSLCAAIRNLEDNFLIEPLNDYDGWKVFLRSKDLNIWKRDYLNKKVMASYRHIL